MPPHVSGAAHLGGALAGLILWLNLKLSWVDQKTAAGC